MSETNGNIAAMRRELETLVGSMESFAADCGDETLAMNIRLYGRGIRRILSNAAPARNCDVGTAAEQAERFHRYCRAHRTFFAECSASCPFTSAPDINHCQSGWAQLPYEAAAKEGGAL